jgi:hypothetical protein
MLKKVTRSRLLSRLQSLLLGRMGAISSMPFHEALLTAP